MCVTERLLALPALRSHSLTSGSRGGGALTAADLLFFYVQNASFSQFCLRSQIIMHNFERNTAKTRLQMTFTLTFNTFNAFLHPPPVDKVHAL